eukprot:11276851-Ditylum_brightwellii.AAC.1
MMRSAETNSAVAWVDKIKEVKETVKRTPSKVAFIQDKMDKEYKDTHWHLNALQKEFISTGNIFKQEFTKLSKTMWEGLHIHHGN